MDLEEERLKFDLQEATIFCNCDDCGSEIYYGNEYYVDEILCNSLCEDCFDKRQSQQKRTNYRIAGEG
jgi:hypothetical protein